MPTRRTIKPEDIIGVIPARWGASRFPGKILTSIGGKPLLSWIISGCRKSYRVKHWIVATDDLRIAYFARASGAEVIMTPKSLKSGSDRVAHVARKLKAKWIINWQGDEWLPNGRPIDLLVETLELHRDCPVATLARPLDATDIKNLNRVKVVLSQSSRALYFSRAPIPHRIEGSGPLLLHLGAYAFERSMLLKFAQWPKTPLEKCERLEQLRLLEHDVPIAVGKCRTLTHGVDAPADAVRLARLIRNSRSPK